MTRTRKLAITLTGVTLTGVTLTGAGAALAGAALGGSYSTALSFQPHNPWAMPVVVADHRWEDGSWMTRVIVLSRASRITIVRAALNDSLDAAPRSIDLHVSVRRIANSPTVIITTSGCDTTKYQGRTPLCARPKQGA